MYVQTRLAAEKSTAAKFTGERQHRVIPSVGHNLPQEAPQAFADAVWELAWKKNVEEFS